MILPNVLSVLSHGIIKIVTNKPAIYGGQMRRMRNRYECGEDAGYSFIFNCHSIAMLYDYLSVPSFHKSLSF